MENVSTPTLIIHGLADDRCPVGQAEQWFASLRMRGCVVEMVLYPGASHMFMATGRPSHRIDAFTRLTDWLTENCAVSALSELSSAVPEGRSGS